jgi:hypothetical protein
MQLDAVTFFTIIKDEFYKDSRSRLQHNWLERLRDFH